MPPKDLETPKKKLRLEKEGATVVADEPRVENQGNDRQASGDHQIWVDRSRGDRTPIVPTAKAKSKAEGKGKGKPKSTSVRLTVPAGCIVENDPKNGPLLIRRYLTKETASEQGSPVTPQTPFLKCKRRGCKYTETCGLLELDCVWTFQEYYCILCGSDLILTSPSHAKDYPIRMV
jgi:hypothetical protein